MIGPPNGYLSGYNGSGELYEGWYDSNGHIIRSRHHSRHKNSKAHPKNPHDHRGTKDENGKPTISHEAEDPDPDFEAPESKEEKADKILDSIAIVYIAYTCVEIIVSIVSAPFTGGTSLIPALIP